MFNFEDAKNLLKAIFLFFLPMALILLSGITIGIKGVSLITGNERRNKEWNQKVNNCVLDKNYRKDCELILYKDVQMHRCDNSDTTVVPMPIYYGGK